MTQALNFLLSLIVGLLGLILTVGGAVERALRAVMTQAGIGAETQRPLLIAAGVLLVFVAVRLFGRLIGLLVALFLILLLLHVLMPGVSSPPVVHV